ncbi:MAG: hypothetical protein E7518_03325 [Ruminococcaceae bacterium]|nr:hypothetical protein [Oscillospiraceae bacterium]HHV31017.1 hypothetical protein [Clostridiales bacterium]
MADKNRAPQNDFSIDEILAEAHTLKEKEQPEAASAKESAQPEKDTEGNRPACSSPEAIAREASRALNQNMGGQPFTRPDSSFLEQEPEKKRRSLFRRRKKAIPEFREEEDIYYGLQLKSLEEYREDYERTIRIDSQKIRAAEGASKFAYLFEKDDESEPEGPAPEQFEQIHRERQERLERVMREAGLDQNEIEPLIDFAPPEEEFSAGIASSVKIASSAEPEQSAAEEAAAPEHPEPGIPQPAPSPVPQPAPAPAPKPEIPPEPVQPEIPQPLTEPTFTPQPAQPGSPQPASSPVIRCEETPDAQEHPPVKEPVTVPVVQEEITPPPAVREPPLRQEPRSKAPERRPNQIPTGFRSLTGRPVHMIESSSFPDLLKSEIQNNPNYAEPEPTAPISLPQPPVTGEETRLRPPVLQQEEVPEPEEEAQEEELSAEPAKPEEEPIPFPIPTAPPVADEFSSEEPRKEETPAKPEKKRRFHVFGTEEEDNDATEELQDEPEELDDYTSASDAPAVANDIAANLSRFYLRFAVTGLCTLLLFFFGLLGEYAGILPSFLQVSLDTKTYLILNMIFLVIAGAFSAAPVAGGLKGLFTFQANADSAVAVALIASIAQSAVLFSAQERLNSGTLHLYSSLTALALFLNAAGKLSMMRRIRSNFRFVSSPDQKKAVLLYDDYNTSLLMTKGVVLDSPVVAYQVKADFLKHFLKLSYEPDPSEQSSQMMGPIGFVCSLVLGIVAFVLSRDWQQAVTAFSAAACISVPFMNMLSVNLPLKRLVKIASRCGAMVVGFPAVDAFSGVNAVMVDAKDLFPKGTVVLNGIKTFAGQRIDEAIVDATALMCSVGGPLSDVFDQIIQNRREMLPKVENVTYEDEKGVSGWVSGRRILIGNRALLETHGIEPPSADYEEKYIQGGKNTVYLGVGGDLVAVFVVSYNSDLRRSMELRRMENNGISLVVRTRDPNITPQLLADCFHLDEHCIRVLPERLGEVYEELTQTSRERAPAMLATKGRPTTMMRMLSACVRQRSNITVAVALQNISVILGLLLVGLLTCYSGLKLLGTVPLLLYELFWVAVVWLIPRLRKP